MLNIHDLERRWLKYKIKSFAPFVLMAIFLSTGFISALIYYPTTNDINTTTQENIVLSNPVEVVNTVQEKTSEPLVKEVQENELDIDIPQNTQHVETDKVLVLKPSLHFMDNIEEGLDPYVNDVHNETIDSYEQNNQVDNTVEVAAQTQGQNQIQAPNKKKLTITTQKNENDLKDVIRRFKKNKNPALSLFIAKRYYQLKQYQKSYNYALMTNEINKEIDESWIIFSKSLVKLGQHELAVVTLKSYLKTNKSSQADILLRKIEAGTFR